MFAAGTGTCCAFECIVFLFPRPPTSQTSIMKAPAEKGDGFSIVCGPQFSFDPLLLSEWSNTSFQLSEAWAMVWWAGRGHETIKEQLGRTPS